MTREHIDCLHLNIYSFSCKCGNRWTSSSTWLASLEYGYLGGTPNPLQEEKLQYQSFSHEDRQVNGCFRCVPLQLGEGWTRPLVESFKPRPKAGVATQQAIEDELLS